MWKKYQFNTYDAANIHVTLDLNEAIRIKVVHMINYNHSK